MEIRIGDNVGGYQVIGTLGRGGMGQVFRARNLLTLRDEAMKVIVPEMNESADAVERFQREMRVHASLQHPNIVSLRTAFQYQDGIVMILELVEGIGLDEAIRRGPLAPGVALHYLEEILGALAYAHSRGVIHRDIKPANILITADGHARLTDFGIARADRESRITRTGFAVGSLAYMSPEQISGAPVDARSDLYSIGVTLYEAVTGRRPFENADARVRSAPAAPAEVRPGIPVSLSDVIFRALATDPSARFASAEEFRAALAAFGPAGPAEAAATVVVEQPGISSEELARVESGLVRALGPIARHMVTTAARRYTNVQDLCHELAAQIPVAAEREAFLKMCAKGAGTPTPAPPEARPATATTAPPALDAGWLSAVEQAFAAYVGPIARVLVRNAARRCATREELCQALAGEIPAASDRQRFLASIGREGR